MRKGRKRLRTSVSQSGTFETSWAFSFYSISPSPLTHIVTHFFREKNSILSSEVFLAFLFTISLCAHVEMTDFRRCCYLSFPFLPRNWIYTRRAGETRNLPLFFFRRNIFGSKVSVYFKCAKSRSLAKLFRFTFGECPASGARDCTLEIVA